MKETLKNSDIDSIVACGGGIETAAAVAWAVGQGYKPFLFTDVVDRNNPAVKGMTRACEDIAEYFDLPFKAAYNDMPMENTSIPPTDYSFAQAIKLVLGNPSIRFKYIINGGNAEDSMQQRVQIRYLQRIITSRWSMQYDMHGISWKSFLNVPIMLFPFEYLQKSEIIGIMMNKHPELVKKVWTCVSPIKEENNYRQCGQCGKCTEWSSALRVAKQAKLKIQEGLDYGYNMRK
jgi:hypothetical protein